jgi:hypothetical protein
LTATAVVAAALLVSAAVASADQPGNSALGASGGLVATGGFSAPNGDVFTATFVIPTSGAAESPHSGGVSFARPWASLEKWNGAPPGIGTADPCSTVTNPTSWSAGYQVSSPYYSPPGQQPRSGVYVDIVCNDGSGFQYYRVRWDDAVSAFGGLQPVADTSQRPPEWSYWGSAVQQLGGAHGTLLVRADGAENASLSICGFDGSTFHCLAPTGPSGTGGVLKPTASLVSVFAG